MDPTEVLRQADQAISDGFLDSAAYHLMTYSEWRRAGGFEPTIGCATPGQPMLMGDQFEGDCYLSLADARRHDKRPPRLYRVTLLVENADRIAGRHVVEEVSRHTMYEAINAAKESLPGNHRLVEVISAVVV